MTQSPQDSSAEQWPGWLRQSGPPIAPSQRDLAQLHTQGVFFRLNDPPDRAMLRVRLPGNELSAAQAKAVAFVAYQLGHGIVDLTMRANVQIQGVRLSDAPRAVERLESVGLTCRRTGRACVRNVYGHPFSGLDRRELIDVRQLCRDVTQFALEDPALADLPHKFNIAINGGGRRSAHYWTQDLSFLATRNVEGEVVFQVLAGGCQGRRPTLASLLPIIVRPAEVAPLARAALDLFLRHGRRTQPEHDRFRAVVENLGARSVAAELEKAIGYALPTNPTAPPCPTEQEELIGWFPQSQPDLWILGLCVPVGRLSWEQLEGLALLSQRWGGGILRTTYEQGIAVTGVPAKFRDAVSTDLCRYGLSPHADSLTRSVVACTGKQFCNLAATETKGRALQLIETLRAAMLTVHGIRIGISGCASACGQHHTADIGLKGVRVRKLFGSRDGFDVFLGGGLAGQVHLALPYQQGVEVEQVALLLEEVIREFHLRHQPGQTFSMYWREKLRAEYQSPDEFPPSVWLCEACQYRHRGEDPPVFCPKCAALRRHFARIEEGDQGAAASTPGVALINGQAAPLVQILAGRAEEDASAAHRLAESLFDWLQGFVGETAVSVPSAQKSPRGRPKDPKIADRNAFIIQVQREHPRLSHAELARLIQKECREEITTHMVRNALKAEKRAR